MMTSENTIIMIANMKAAAIDDAIFSRAPPTPHILSHNSPPPLSAALPAGLAARTEPLRPVFRDALHQLLEFRTGLRLQGLEFDTLSLHRLLDLVVGFLNLLTGGR